MTDTSWTAARIREKFLSFFASKGHKIVPSAPMVVKNDPTLMFTNAGMNQFKDYFLGNKQPESTRICNTQKCLRVSGKHNDLEEVGVDTYHHTMFEMLGNWSFGDYFKEEAIQMAWQLLSEVYSLDKDRLYITVFGGDEKDGLERDNESIAFWQAHVPEDRILSFGRKDNFWEMGESGPCGPCSEIHIDLRSENERAANPGNALVNTGHPQVIEIWNLVFIEYNRDASGKLHSLPSKHVDTGMGLERLVRVMQHKRSNYDSDLFTPIINAAGDFVHQNYEGTDALRDIAFRVVADHLRAVCFAIADGQLPSNTGAGYVIRRILRRSVRYAYSALGYQDPLLHQLVPVLVAVLGNQFPELKAQQSFLSEVIKEEEENFLR
ncbi:MAG: alanine--tRNA ligase, partial [Flavobacteriales bacterium]|nr:alanine--tRNA ligase [Flavobacteriales bacterium]